MDHLSNGVNILSKNKNFSYFEKQCTSHCLVQGKFLKQITKGTVCRHKVSTLFQEPFVLRGYRQIGKSWLYYISSIFTLHNESVNIWSHVLATILVFTKFQRFSEELDFINDPYTWPMLAGILSSMALFAISFTAHWLQSKSCVVHNVAFMFDYAGVGLYAFGSTVMFLEYSSTDRFFYAARNLFLPIGMMLSCAACIGCCLSKIIYERPYPFARKLWQIIPVGGAYLLLISPVVHRLYLCWAHDVCTSTFYPHVHHIIWFLVSAMFFAGQFPQSRAPIGSCDHFFHGHQLFHVAIMTSILIQLDAIFKDFLTSQDVIRARPAPTFFFSFGPAILVFSFEIISISYFYNVVKTKHEEKPENLQHCNDSQH